MLIHPQHPRLLWHQIPVLALMGMLAATPSSWSRDLHVDAAHGNDDYDGLTVAQAWRSLQRAADEVRPGDTVWVRPGVYRGAVRLFAKGTAGAPVVFRATKKARGAVIVTNAHEEIRAGERKWRLEDADLGLYSVPFDWDMPARVLYDGIDLFPFASVARLKSFTTPSDAPGPRHGYALNAESHRLFLRLHGSGRYGSSDPSQHVIAVAPPTGLQREGTLVGAPHHYCIGVLERGDAHVVIDGFTFETPGVAGVYTESDHVTVRRCWFLGCRTGIAGNYQDRLTTDPTGTDYFSLRLSPAEQQRAAAHVTVEYCDFSQFPAYQDALEVLSSAMMRRSVEADYFIYWARKDPRGLPDERYTYEIGIAARIGRGWTIRHNQIHDSFEGLSCHATWASVGLSVEDNVFERLLDNAVETEDHAKAMMVRRNVVIDALEPFSFQPLRGPPWPGPAYFLQNIIFNTPERIDVWLPPRPHPRGAFKIGIKTNNWERNPGLRGQARPQEFQLSPPGIIFAYNTVLWTGGRLINPQGDPHVPIHGIKFYDNVLAADYLVSRDPDQPGIYSGHFEFSGNAVAPATPGQPGPGQIPAEGGGHLFATAAALDLDESFRPRADSPLRGAAKAVTELSLELPNIGALQPGDNWYPPAVGPLAPAANVDHDTN